MRSQYSEGRGDLPGLENKRALRLERLSDLTVKDEIQYYPSHRSGW